VPNQVGFADLRPYFPGKKYIGADMLEGPGVDVILDMHNIDIPDGSAGTVLSLDTFEHVEYPRKALSEIYRILKPDGIFVLSSVMNFPIHDYPYDYWRFTPEAFKSLLKPFESSLVELCGDSNFPHIVVGIGFKGSVPAESIASFRSKINEWKETWKLPKKKKVRGIKKLLKKLRKS